MHARLRVSLPDRTGSLARLAAALGNAHADIVSVIVLSAEGGRAVDDLVVDLVDRRHLGQVVRELHQLRGVRLEGVAAPAPPSGGHGMLGLVAQMLGDPERRLQTLADGLPAAAGADAAQVLRFTDAEGAAAVVAASTAAPPRPLWPVRGLPQRVIARDDDETSTAIAPLGDGTALLVHRQAGPAFHSTELWQLETLAAIAALRPVPTPAA